MDRQVHGRPGRWGRRYGSSGCNGGVNGIAVGPRPYRSLVVVMVPVLVVGVVPVVVMVPVLLVGSLRWW